MEGNPDSPPCVLDTGNPCSNSSVWARNDKYNLVISAWMPKSSVHGWQHVDYDGLKSVGLLPTLAWISASMPK